MTPRRPIVTAGVLAGAYVGSPTKARLTHSVELDAQGRYHRVICDTVQIDNIADDLANTPRELEPPTCPRCLLKMTGGNQRYHGSSHKIGGPT
jgi:hypothetical protein